MKQLPAILKVNENFNSIYKLKPSKRSEIILFDKINKEFRNREIFRSYVSYGVVPEFDSNVKKSYMFVNKELKVPSELVPFFEFAKSIDTRYNQMVVNWYNPEDYIELHRDCTSKMLDNNSPILMINLNETDDIYSIRSLNFVSIETGEQTSVPLLNNSYLTITNNSTHKHYVGKGCEKRICITFRMMKEIT